MTVTAISLISVPQFIYINRTIRDLYGSYLILSYLVQSICKAAEDKNLQIIMPGKSRNSYYNSDLMIIEGILTEEEAKIILKNSWKNLTYLCKQWIEKRIQGQRQWHKQWDLYSNYNWDILWVEAINIQEAIHKLNKAKLCNRWTAINWQGESGNYGVDAIAHYGMGNYNDSQKNTDFMNREINSFYNQLKKFSPFKEYLSDVEDNFTIIELVKWLVTDDEIFSQVFSSKEEATKFIFPDFLDFKPFGEKSRCAYFYGEIDIDNIISKYSNEPVDFKNISQNLQSWIHTKLYQSIEQHFGDLVYITNTKFLGTFYFNSTFSMHQRNNWLCDFIKLWSHNDYSQSCATSIGYVYANSKVSQIDILYHCQRAKDSAEKLGGYRVGFRILFSNGHWLECICPYWFLEVIFSDNLKYDWTAIHNDILDLEYRHAFSDDDNEVSLGIFEIYFGKSNRLLLMNNLWNNGDRAGIIGNKNNKNTHSYNLVNNWIINFIKVCFHIYK
jgi:CRISPR-associated protein Cmr2